MIPCHLLLLLPSDELGLAFQGAADSTDTLTGDWTKVIAVHSEQQRGEIPSSTGRIEVKE